MSRVADIHTSIWMDEDFVDGLGPDAKLVYIWAFSNDHCNMAGLYNVTRSAMVCETTLPLDRLTAALAELEENDFLYHERGVLWVRSHIKRLRQRNPNIAKSIRKTLISLLGHPLAERLREFYGDDEWLLREGVFDGRETVPNGPANGSQAVSERSGDGFGTVQGKGKGTVKGRGNGSRISKGSGIDPLSPPDDLPDELAPTLAKLKATLDRIHSAKGGIPPTVRSVGLVLVHYPQRDHLKAAGDLEHWLTNGRGQGKKVRDVVAFFRNWIKDEPDVTPPVVKAPGSGGVSDLEPEE